MINANQLRAGRALLGWTQKQLAAAAKLSTVIVNRIENGETRPRAQTMQKLRMCLEKAGVEFLAGSGVRLAGECVAVRMLDGVNCFADYLEDVLLTRLMYKNQDTLLHGVDEQKFLRAGGPKMREYVTRLAEHQLKERILVRSGDRFFIAATNMVTYRWIAPELFGKIPTVTYGPKVAFIFWGPPQRILVVENPMLAETFRQQFEFLWRMAQKPPFNPREIQEIVDDNLTRTSQTLKPKRKR